MEKNSSILLATAKYMKIKGEWGNVTPDLVYIWLNLEHDDLCKQKRICKCYRCFAEKSLNETKQIISAYNGN